MKFEGYKDDLKEFLAIAVEAKRAYWDANRDVELIFSDDAGNISDLVVDKIEDVIKTLAASSEDIGADEVDYLLNRLGYENV